MSLALSLILFLSFSLSRSLCVDLYTYTYVYDHACDKTSTPDSSHITNQMRYKSWVIRLIFFFLIKSGVEICGMSLVSYDSGVTDFHTKTSTPRLLQQDFHTRFELYST